MCSVGHIEPKYSQAWFSELSCAACRYGSGTEDHPDQGSDALPVRPEFPPPGLQLIPAFAPGLDAKLGADMLQAWTFLHSFGDLLGLPAATLDELLAAGEEVLFCHSAHFAAVLYTAIVISAA